MHYSPTDNKYSFKKLLIIGVQKKGRFSVTKVNARHVPHKKKWVLCRRFLPYFFAIYKIDGRTHYCISLATW